MGKIEFGLLSHKLESLGSEFSAGCGRLLRSVPDVGTTNTWNNLPAFNAMLETLETALGPTHEVDIQSYVKWREAIAAGPVIPVAVAFSLASPLIWREIVFDAKPTTTYLLLHSFNLCHWQ